MKDIKVLIAPGHYLFSDKYGSEPLWAFEIVKHLSSKLSSLDVIVGVVDLIQPIPENVRLFPIYSGKSRNPFIEFVKRLLFYPLLLIKFILLNSKQKYQIVHHMFPLSLATINLIVFYIKLFKIPIKLVLGPLQLPQDSSSPHDLDIVLVGEPIPLPLSNLINNLYHVLLRFIKPISLQMFNFADLIIFNSNVSRVYYSKFIPKVKQVVIPTGVEYIKENIFRSTQKEVKIICVGGLSVRKGQIYLLDAFLYLSKKYSNLSLTFVGDGDERTSYESYVTRHDLKRVKFTGRLPHTELTNFYKSHDIFCLPSISDPSPTVVLEAMSYGLPVVASDVGSVSEMIGDAGLIVKKGNAEQLDKALSKLIENKQLRVLLGNKGKERIEKIYNWDKISEQWLKLYIDNI